MADFEEIVISPRGDSFGEKTERQLKEELGKCPDLAFAHLPLVLVPSRQQSATPVLFVWLESRALGVSGTGDSDRSK